MSEKYTPTTKQVRDGYRYDPEAEYHDPVTPHHVTNGRAFDRWYAAEIRKAKAEAWEDGHSWGWSDAQEAHDVRQHMDRADWDLRMPNPYREEGGS